MALGIPVMKLLLFNVVVWENMIELIPMIRILWGNIIITTGRELIRWYTKRTYF